MKTREEKYSFTRHIKLNVKVLLIMFFVVLLIMSIVVSYSFSMTKSLLINQTEQNLTLENESIATSISSIFEKKGEAVYQLTMLPIFQDFIKENLSLDEIKQYEQYDELQNLLTVIDKQNDDFFLASIIHETNNYFISGYDYISDPSYDIDSRLWYQEAKDIDGLAYSSPYLDYETDEWTILITYPIKVEKERHGFFSVTVHMNLIADEVKKFERNNKKIVLSSHNGYVLYDTENMWDSLNTSTQQGVGTFHVEKEGQRYYASMKELSSLGWNIAVYVPEDEVLAPLEQFEKRILMTWFITITVLLITLAFILQHFLKDIPQIVQQIHNIKNGDFSKKLSIKRRDEIGEIATAIDHMADQIENQMEVLDYNANHDSLTGLPNRAALEDKLQRWMKEADEKDAIVTAFLDIDFFKSINDSKGHALGDQLLIQVAKRIDRFMSKSDFLSRFGGDEFVLIFRSKEKKLKFLYEKIEQIHESFTQPFYLSEQPVYITASIGISIFRADATSLDQLLVNADTALYHAKRTGRNRIYYYNYDLKLRMEKEVQLKNNLRIALLKDEFFLHFQPKLNIDNPEERTVEALLRWKHPEMGMVSPAEFIPLAEETGLIIEIGDWVLDASLQMYKRMEKRNIPLKRIAVNMSAIQFQEANFVQKIYDKLTYYDVPSSALEIEITESIIIEQQEEMIHKLHELTELGIQVSLDDFGTGYSSLNYLRTMPIDFVKVDRSFIVKIEKDQIQRSILKMIIELGEKLHFQVVAEGVEEKNQHDILIQMGVNVIQGYYYSKPLDENDLLRFLQET